MVMMGAAGLMALGYSSMVATKSVNKQARLYEQTSDVISILTNMKILLSDRRHCRASFETESPSNTPNLGQLRFFIEPTSGSTPADSQPVFTNFQGGDSTTTYGQSRIRLINYALSDTEMDADDEIQAPGSNATGITQFIVTLSRSKQDFSSFQSDNTKGILRRKFLLWVRTDGAGDILECQAIGGSIQGFQETDSPTWQARITPPGGPELGKIRTSEDIEAFTNPTLPRVGIGYDLGTNANRTPSVHLDIIGGMTVQGENRNTDPAGVNGTFTLRVLNNQEYDPHNPSNNNDPLNFPRYENLPSLFVNGQWHRFVVNEHMAVYEDPTVFRANFDDLPMTTIFDDALDTTAGDYTGSADCDCPASNSEYDSGTVHRFTWHISNSGILGVDSRVEDPQSITDPVLTNKNCSNICRRDPADAPRLTQPVAPTNFPFWGAGWNHNQ